MKKECLSCERQRGTLFFASYHAGGVHIIPFCRNGHIINT